MTKIFNLKSSACLTLVALAVSACGVTTDSVVKDGGAKLSGAEMQELYGKGVNVTWTSQSGSSGTGTYGPDGAAQISFNQTTWTGTWRVDQDLFCTTYADRDAGAERCQSVYRRAEGDYAWFTNDDAFGGTMQIIE